MLINAGQNVYPAEPAETAASVLRYAPRSPSADRKQKIRILRLLWMNPGASVAASVPMPAPAAFGILWKMNLLGNRQDKAILVDNITKSIL